MKKEQMFQELIEVYTDDPDMFDENKIKYLKWLDKIKNYQQTKQAYRFVFTKLFLCLIPLRKLWSCHSKEVWSSLKIMNRNCDEVCKLREELHDFYIIWYTRPKFLKR